MADDKPQEKTEDAPPEATTAGNPFTDQEDAAESTKDAESVKAVADPSAHGGLPKWPKEEMGTPVVVNEQGNK